MRPESCIYELGMLLHKTAWKDVSRIFNNELTSSEIGDLDYQISGLLSFAEKAQSPDDLNERFNKIRSFDKVLEEARLLCKNNDLARSYISYLDMKRSWALHHFSSSVNT